MRRTNEGCETYRATKVGTNFVPPIEEGIYRGMIKYSVDSRVLDNLLQLLSYNIQYTLLLTTINH